VEDKVVADSNSEINTEMKSLDHDSSFLNDSSAVPRPSLQVFNRMPTMQQLNLGSASPPQYFSGPRVFTTEWNSRFDNVFQKLLSVPSPTPLAPPLPDPPPEPTNVVILPPEAIFDKIVSKVLDAFDIDNTTHNSEVI
ncbi:hypothetical protein A2U01_0043513, partial [Trifolium medium]|nr:hypothetical protein [Trifolium medium]